MRIEHYGRCPFCLSASLKYNKQHWTTTTKETRLILRCADCDKNSVWKLEELMSD